MGRATTTNNQPPAQGEGDDSLLADMSRRKVTSATWGWGGRAPYGSGVVTAAGCCRLCVAVGQRRAPQGQQLLDARRCAWVTWSIGSCFGGSGHPQ